MLFSIIIATKNDQFTIGAVLESTLYLAKKEKAELIIVRGSSTDDTQTVIEQFLKKNAIYFYCTKVIQDQGTSLALARKLGCNESIGDMVVLLDGDTIISADFCQKINEPINGGYDIIAPHLSIKTLDRATAVFGAVYNVIEGVSLKTAKDSVLPPARIYARHVIKKFNGYPQLSKFFGEDRLATSIGIRMGFKYKYSPDLKLHKLDQTSLVAYIEKHERYAKGIHTDITPEGKSLLREYLLLRKLTYLNIFIPILSLFYCLNVSVTVTISAWL